MLVWPKVVSTLTPKEKEKKSKNQRRKQKVVLSLVSHVVLD
jgi:hypothetical protein